MMIKGNHHIRYYPGKKTKSRWPRRRWRGEKRRRRAPTGTCHSTNSKWPRLGKERKKVAHRDQHVSQSESRKFDEATQAKEKDELSVFFEGNERSARRKGKMRKKMHVKVPHCASSSTHWRYGIKIMQLCRWITRCWKAWNSIQPTRTYAWQGYTVHLHMQSQSVDEYQLPFPVLLLGVVFDFSWEQKTQSWILLH